MQNNSTFTKIRLLNEEMMRFSKNICIFVEIYTSSLCHY